MTRTEYHAARRAGQPLPKPQPLVGTLFWMQAVRRAKVVGRVLMERRGWERPGSARPFLRPLSAFTDCRLPGGAL